MYKKIILLLILAVFILCGCAKAKKEPVANTLDDITKRGNVIIGVKTDTYPFGFKDKNGKYTGYDIDLANLIGEGIFNEKGKVKFVPLTASDRMMKLFSEDVDMVIAKMIKTFEQISKDRKYSIYVTADHGELFDYNGHWGHNNLLLEQGKVPFFMKRNRSAHLPAVVSHYQIGKLIADDLGFKIVNPNEQNNTFYMHGNNIDFPYNFIEYQIKNNGQIIEIKTGNTATSQQ